MLDILDDSGAAKAVVSARDVRGVIAATPIRLKHVAVCTGQQQPCGWTWTPASWRRCCASETVGLVVLRAGTGNNVIDLYRGTQKCVQCICRLPGAK